MKDDLHILQENSGRAADFLKALAHQTRLLILCHISDQQLSVHDLEERLHTSQSNVSQHLAKLRSMDILTRDKVGNQVFYSVKDPAVLDLISRLQQTFC